MKFEEIRKQFPALESKVFLDAACVSLAPHDGVQAIRRFLDIAALCPAPSSTAQHILMDDLRAAARPELARLIHADESEIALVESTSHGLGLTAASLPLEPGDRVLMSDLEFPQVAVPWTQLRRERGIELDFVPNRGGAILIEDVADRMTDRTRVVAISSVQWSNGFRCDLDALAETCHTRDALLVVDAIQQLGAVPLDVRKTPVDILACGGHKWLNSPFGTGFLYIRRDVQERLHPPIAGYMSLEPPPGGWENYFQTPSTTPNAEYRFVNEARRFETGGTANYPGAIGLAASVGLINRIGMDRIFAHVVDLTDYLIGNLRERSVRIVTPAARENRSGIVTFSVGTAQEDIRLMQHLLTRKVLVSVRYTSQVGGIRVSCHLFNTRDDIDALLHNLVP